MKHFCIASWLRPADAVPVWIEHSKSRRHPEAPHTHDCMEIMYIRSGSACCRINNHRYPVVRGDFYVFAPGDIHEFTIAGELSYDTLQFSPEIFSEEEKCYLASNPLYSQWLTQGNIPGKKINFHLNAAEELDRKFDELAAECQKLVPCNNMLRKSLFVCLLFFVLSKGVPAETGETGNDLQLSSLFDYIAKNSSRELTISTLARVANVSPNYLNEFMHRTIGQGAMEYVLRFRVEQARNALEHSKKNVAEIAADTGFYDASHLIRIFKKYTGVTPGRYRKLIERS